MKFACASGAFGSALERGDLTQIEFVELCARTIAADGVVLDARHFPRTDADYLAQLKKMAVDLGLDIAALSDDAFFTADDAAMEATLARATSLGTPLITARLAAETALSWSAQLERLNAATSLAKAANVTLALRNAPGTFGATFHDLKRAMKEADSAWLRLATDPCALDDIAAAASKTVLVWASLDADPATTLREFASFRGYVALEGDGTADATRVRALLEAWRSADVRPHETSTARGC